MNLRILSTLAITHTAFAGVQGKKLSGHLDKSFPNWIETLNDFKILVHAVTFGEDIPSHHTNPLQMMLVQESAQSKIAKNPFKIPKGWFGNGIGNKPKNKKFKNKSRKGRKIVKSSKTKMQPISASQLRDQQSADDLALLNFLVQLEDPNSRSAVQTPQKKKHLSSLIMAEKRYNEIKKKLKLSEATPKKERLLSKYKMKESKKFTSKITESKPGNSGKK